MFGDYWALVLLAVIASLSVSLMILFAPAMERVKVSHAVKGPLWSLIGLNSVCLFQEVLNLLFGAGLIGAGFAIVVATHQVIFDVIFVQIVSGLSAHYAGQKAAGSIGEIWRNLHGYHQKELYGGGR